RISSASRASTLPPRPHQSAMHSPFRSCTPSSKFVDNHPGCPPPSGGNLSVARPAPSTARQTENPAQGTRARAGAEGEEKPALSGGFTAAQRTSNIEHPTSNIEGGGHDVVGKTVARPGGIC